MAADAIALAPRSRPGRRLHLPRWTLRLRFTLLYGAIALVSGAGVVAITYWLLDRFLARLSPLRALGLPGTLGPVAPVPGGQSIYMVTFQGGTEIGNQAPNTLILPPPNGTFMVVAGPPPPPANGTTWSAPASAQTTSLVALSPRQVAAGAALQHNDELHQLLLRSSVAMAIVAVVALALGWFLASRALRPLRVMASTTQEISEENLHRRLALTGPRDELRHLGDTIDGLLARLEGAFEAQRSFVANASHELRTPLTLARALLQMRLSDPDSTLDAYQGTCEEVLAAEDEQEELIDSLLVLARSQYGPEQEETFDLADVAGEVAEAHERTARQEGVAWHVSLAPARVRGDSGLVHRLVSNLVDNAVRYNVPGGRVDVKVESYGGRAVLTVANSGPVVPAGDLERLLQPFQRLGSQRRADSDGLGLGLSIVAAVAKAHSAHLETRPGEEGGLDITVTFPAIAPETGAE